MEAKEQERAATAMEAALTEGRAVRDVTPRTNKRPKLAYGRQVDCVTDAISLGPQAAREGGFPPSCAGVNKSETSAGGCPGTPPIHGELLPGVGDRVYSPLNFSESAIGGSEKASDETSSAEADDYDPPSASPASH